MRDFTRDYVAYLDIPAITRRRVKDHLVNCESGVMCDADRTVATLMMEHEGSPINPYTGKPMYDVPIRRMM